MAFTPTLPGVRVSRSDAYYSAYDSNPDAQRVLIIAKPGAAATAALYNPVRYTSEVTAKTALGVGSDAHVAYVQALRSGASNIFVSTVNAAACATAAGRESELVTALALADMVEPDLIVPFGFYANELIPGTTELTKNIATTGNGGIVGAEGDTRVTITTTTAHTFLLGDIVTIAGVAPVALMGSKVITHIVSPTKFEYACTALTAQNVTDLAVTGGTAVRAAAPLGMSNNARNVAETCFLMCRDLNPCMGVMAVKPIEYAGDLPTASEVDDYVTALVDTKITNFVAEDFAPIANVVDALAAVVPVDETVATDLGKYLGLFCGAVIVRGQVANDISNSVEYTGPEAVVAGQVYSTPLEDAITVSPITNVTGIPNNFSRSQKVSLITARCNPICLSSSNTVITLDGWTLAGPDDNDEESVYNRISTVRIVNEVVKSTRNELEKFIGMQASTARLNSIETKLRTVYNAFKQAGILRNAEFKIEYSQSTGTLTVNMNLVPFGEIREISVTIAVQINA